MASHSHQIKQHQNPHMKTKTTTREKERERRTGDTSFRPSATNICNKLKRTVHSCGHRTTSRKNKYAIRTEPWRYAHQPRPDMLCVEVREERRLYTRRLDLQGNRRLRGRARPMVRVARFTVWVHAATCAYLFGHAAAWIAIRVVEWWTWPMKVVRRILLRPVSIAV